MKLEVNLEIKLEIKLKIHLKMNLEIKLKIHLEINLEINLEMNFEMKLEIHFEMKLKKYKLKINCLHLLLYFVGFSIFTVTCLKTWQFILCTWSTGVWNILTNRNIITFTNENTLATSSESDASGSLKLYLTADHHK